MTKVWTALVRGAVLLVVLALLPFGAAHAQTPRALPSFFIAVNERPLGPLDQTQLGMQVANGNLTAVTLVWTAGMPDWQPAGTLPMLAPLLAVVRAAPPPASPQLPPLAPPPNAFLVGTWRSGGATTIPEFGPAQTDLTQVFTGDGRISVSGTITTTVPGATGPSQLNVAANGTWHVQPETAGRLALSVELAMTLEGANIAPSSTTSSDTSSIEVIDADSFRDGEGVTWQRVR